MKNRIGLLIAPFVFAAIIGGCRRPVKVNLPQESGTSASTRKIVFDSNRGGKFDIYTMFPDGGQPTDLTSKIGTLNMDPTWDKDGDKIYFTSNARGALQIFSMSSDGTDVKELTSGKSESYDPSISSDGDTLAYVTASGSGSRIYVADASGGSAHPLVKARENEAAPAVSPDGHSVAFVKLTRGGAGTLCVADASAGTEQCLGVTVVPDGGPAWSPDGQTLAFVSEQQGLYKLETIPAAGGTPNVVLTSGDGLGSPSYDPDSRQIAYMQYLKKSFYDQHWKIYVANLNGGNPNPITANVDGSDDRHPAWFGR